MSKKRLKNDLFDKKERDFWKNLHVNIDSFCDKWDELYFEQFKSKFEKLTEPEVKEVLEILKLKNKQTLVADLKTIITIFCVFQFVFDNPKVIGQLLSIPSYKGLIDKEKIFISVLKIYVNNDLTSLYLSLFKQKSGKGNYHFDFNLELNDKDYSKLKEIVERALLTHLKRDDKHKSIFHLRFAEKREETWFFLILKETGDKIVPAIQTNTRVVSGEYILITIYPQNKKLEINTKNKVVAYRIRNYLSKRIDNRLIYNRKTSKVVPESFFYKILVREDNLSKSPQNLELTEVDFRKSNINSEIFIRDTNRKNNIISQLKALKDKDVIKLVDFSEFKSLSFYFEGITFKIVVTENKWNQIMLRLQDKGKPVKELYDFRKTFEDEYGVDLDVYLENEDKSVDDKKIIRLFLNSKTVETGFPEDVENILLTLIEDKIITKPAKTSKRRCLNPKCRKITWIKGDCPVCGNELRIEGNHIDLQIDKKNSINFIYDLIRSNKDLNVKKTKKQIDGTKYELIDILDKKGQPLSVFVSLSTVPEKLIKHYQETAYPLLVILAKFKDALYGDILSKHFECIDYADFYILKSNHSELNSIIKGFINTQKKKWQTKIIEKGFNSYQSLLSKGESYDDQNFEMDIYNILHEILLVGDRLGGKFAGVRAPDGVVAINNASAPFRRYCFAWDCKFSRALNGYQLNDKPQKHRHYIHALKNNDKILLFGGLKTYAIISQNMNRYKYESFYSNLIKGFRWNGNVIFIEEKVLLDIYKFYKENAEVILPNPSSFYDILFKLFSIPWKRDIKPFPNISDRRMQAFFKTLKMKYPQGRLKFDFLRSEFMP